MMIVILVVTLFAIVVPYITSGRVMAHRGVVILNKFIATFADVSWRTILGSAMAGWLMIRP